MQPPRYGPTHLESSMSLKITDGVENRHSRNDGHASRENSGWSFEDRSTPTGSETPILMTPGIQFRGNQQLAFAARLVCPAR